MGNMLLSQKTKELMSPNDSPTEDFHLFPKHMYGGPLGFGDPFCTKLTSIEKDTRIPQRMRDIARTTLCYQVWNKFMDCGKTHRLAYFLRCRSERDEMTNCIKSWTKDDQFRSDVSAEYLNERSHYRENGIRTKRYSTHGHFLLRDEGIDGPPVDSQGRYRPQRPKDWNKKYPDEPPAWASYKYDR